MNIRAELERRISQALTDAAGTAAPLPALVGPAANARFGDYQANGVMAAAKAARANPRELAAKVVEALDLADLAEKVEIAGPGFLNITLSRAFLERQSARAAADDHLDVAPADAPQTVVVDYSGPNLAKEMHVGHLRSTIIGDALANTLEFLGHTVRRQNHVGDWGTQFGMLAAYMGRIDKADAGRLDAITRTVRINDLEEFYREAKQLFDKDEEFRRQAREYVFKLQSGDPHDRTVSKIRQDWEHFRKLSLDRCAEVYQKLGINLCRYENPPDSVERPLIVRGESAYNDDLPEVVEELASKGLLTESQGAQCVFLEQFKGKDGEPLPVIVRKSDGGYLYATTDLAALRYRANVLGADRILYVTDARQALHFAQVFAVARQAGFVGAGVSLEHVPFGVMLGPDGRPFKTREGGTVKLMDLLTEAEQRAAAVVAEKNPDLPDAQRQAIARTVGIGAVKYADLSMDRTSDYKFSWEKMLSFQGNTAPYMQYAYARIRSIFRKGEQEAGDVAAAAIVLAEPAERELARKLLGLEETLAAVASDGKPNALTGYLYDLATAFTAFYEGCPVLKADPATRASRLRLCDLTARTIKLGLGLLGIEVIEQM